MGNLSRESNCLTSFRHMGHRTLRFLCYAGRVHVELLQAGCAECVPAVDQNAGYSLRDVVVGSAELAGVLVDERAGEFEYLGLSLCGSLLRLLEEVRGRVNQFLHPYSNINQPLLYPPIIIPPVCQSPRNCPPPSSTSTSSPAPPYSCTECSPSRPSPAATSTRTCCSSNPSRTSSSSVI